MSNIPELPDVNVLFAAHNTDHEDHAVALRWLDETVAIAVTPITLNGLVRLLLNPVATPNRVSAAEAFSAIDSLRAAPRVTFWPDDIVPGSLGRFSYAVTGHRQVTDLYLLELAASRGGRLVTLDRKIKAALKQADRRFLHLLGAGQVEPIVSPGSTTGW
ncbi:MAG: PIN domain-containing protein [Promicromonosporaceae bacterium]|nr:PIN domain-containing protein [Promicromonosporaceae bacterium]